MCWTGCYNISFSFINFCVPYVFPLKPQFTLFLYFHFFNMATASPLIAPTTATVEPWQTRVAAKQKSCFEKIPKGWLLPTSITDLLQTPLSSTPNRLLQMDIPRKSGIMSERELDITEKYTVGELLEGLRGGKMTSLEVTIAFSKRAAIAQQLVCCFPPCTNPRFVAIFCRGTRLIANLCRLRALRRHISPGPKNEPDISTANLQRAG